MVFLISVLFLKFLWLIFGFPPANHFYNLKSVKIDYGNHSERIIYYKIIKTAKFIDSDGQKIEERTILLKDKKMRFSRYYVYIWMCNEKALGSYFINFSGKHLNSQLQDYLESERCNNGSNCLQYLVDQLKLPPQ